MQPSSFNSGPAPTPSDAPSEPPPGAGIGLLARAADAIGFSSGLPAAIAAGLSLAASRALGAAEAERWAVLAASGTFVVYGLDRLRDTTRDRATSPRRTAFVERNSVALSVAVALAALLLTATLYSTPPSVILLCLGTGAIGLLHRRLKGFAGLKSIYVSAAWVAICAGIPGVSVGIGPHLAWVAGILFAGLAANLIASNLRDDGATLLRRRPRSVLGFARALAVAGVFIAWVAPCELGPLAWIPLAQALALSFFRPSESYGHLAVDGALLAGALASLLHFALR